MMKAIYSLKSTCVKRIFPLLALTLAASNSLAWEAYEFDVSYIANVNNSCVIGMTNLGTKSANDENICDDPGEIVITDCTTESSKIKLSLALSAKMAGKRMWHQAINETSSGSSSCAVGAYNLRLQE